MQIRGIILKIIHVYSHFFPGKAVKFVSAAFSIANCRCLLLVFACCWLFYAVIKSIQQNFICRRAQKYIIEGKQQSGNEKNQRERKCNEIYFQARVKNVVEL